MGNDITVIAGESDDMPDKDIVKALLEISKNNVVSTSNLVHEVDVHEQRIGDLTNRMDNYEQNKLVTPSQKNILRRIGNERISSILNLKRKNGRLTPESKRIREVYGQMFYSRMYGALHDAFGVASYEEVKEIDFEDAKLVLKNWYPDDLVGLKREAEENWLNKHPGQSLNEYLGKLLL